jgi:RNA polymerase sigma-70 factor (ECF subfamily)
MDEEKFLAEQFKTNRAHLKSVAYRMLGSASEAEDAVQEAWIRLSRTDTSTVKNLGGWLTTIVSRVCLDMLRSRKSRREDGLDAAGNEPAVEPEAAVIEREAMLADSVGLAMLVVLEQLSPAERIAFVLHDMFDLPFDDIGPIVERTPIAARQLASRARRRVQGRPMPDEAELAGNRDVVRAFLAASRDGDFAGLLAVLDPDVIFHADEAALRLGSLGGIRGADTVAKVYVGRARTAEVALLDGEVGILVAPGGKLLLVSKVVVRNGRIAEIYAMADADRLAEMEIMDAGN